MSRWSDDDVPRGADYDARFDRLARAGHDVHGEASFVMAFEPRRVLDAGCGTGRVAIELARRGVEVSGIDLDLDMLRAAQAKAPAIEWMHGDLAGFRLVGDDGATATFDVVLTAGNVMIFCASGTESAVVASLAEHVAPGGRLVSGFQLLKGRYDLDAYDADCAAAGLHVAARYASWDRRPFVVGGGYAVSVHRRVNRSVAPSSPS